MKFNSLVARRSFATLLLAGVAAIGSAAQAATLNLTAFNMSSTPGLDLSVDVSADGDEASFVFSNNSTGAAAGSSLARIYFESGLSTIGLTNGTISDSSGVLFDLSFPGPENPPAGNNVNWSGNLANFGAQPSPSQNGIRVGDSLTVTFDYSGDLSALLAALTDDFGNARIAGHVLDCKNGDSCSTLAAAVPVPAALPLLLGGLASLGFAGKRRRRS